MPTTSPIGVEADAATWSSGIAAGAGSHLPIGYYGSAKYRSAMRFIPPSGWQSWTSISKATLTFYISDFQHVGPRNSSIVCRRMSTANLWTKAAGSQNCESGFSGSNTTQYDDLVGYSTNQVQFSSGTTANKAITLDVTDLVNYYWAGNASRIGFVFDPVGSSDYTELWSDEKSGYDATLSITYAVQSPPTAPTNTTPAAGATVASTTPTFAWTHNDPQGDAQSNAEVRVFNSVGTLLYTWSPPTGSTQSLVAQAALTRGATYQFDVRTADAANGFSTTYSARQSFTIKALPVVTIDPVRYMVFSNNAPRLQVKWSSSQPQGRYRVQVASPAFDSGWLSGAATSYILASQPVVDNVAQSITVSVENTDAPALVGTATRSFTPRYGLTTHRRDLGAAPTNWGNPVVASTVPTGASLTIQYGSSSGGAVPTTWYSTLGGAPKNRYVFWRAWFIPSATAGPTLDSITILSDSAVVLVDKWGTTRNNVVGLAAPWSIDPYEYVYGTRSLSVDIVASATTYVAYSYQIRVLQGRSYILTGLMKTVGAAGPSIRLVDTNGGLLKNTLGQDIITPNAAPDADWFTPDQRDVNRYKTPVWVAPSDMTVLIQLRANGTAGGKAWWDGIKLEESTVATPWAPGAVGATVVDAGGVQVDGSGGGIFRYKGTLGAARDVVEGGSHALMFGGDINVWSNGASELDVDSAFIRTIRSAQGTAGFVTRVTGDANDRVQLINGSAGGNVSFGDGTNPPDVNLYRSGPNALRTDDSLLVAGSLSVPSPGLINQIPVVRVYTAGATWTKPAASTGFSHAIVEVQAGGGGGGGTVATGTGLAATGGDGAGGGYCRKLWAATALPATCAVTVGAAGSAASGVAGGAGGTSSFIGTGVSMSAVGGGGGVSSAASGSAVVIAAGGNGGTASGGDLNITGGDGSHGVSLNGANPVALGVSGSSVFGSGVSPVASAAGGGVGTPSHGYGAGGGRATAGASQAARAGGVGGQGVVVVTEFYAS